MGIRGLTGWIHWTAHHTIITSPDWSAWSGKRIGIDILGFLYKTKALRQSHIVYLAKLIAACKKYNIIPVPIFDGKPPESKREALRQRSVLRQQSEVKKTQLLTDMDRTSIPVERRAVVDKELRKLEMNTSYFTSEERDLAKQFFYACGVVSYNASGEADNVLAYLTKIGELDAVISNDFDLLARGVTTLLVPAGCSVPGDASGWKQYNLHDILDAVEFTYPQFVEMCILMGCDYTVGQYSLPYKSAYWTIKYRGSLYETLKLKQIDCAPFVRAYEILTGATDTCETLMGPKQWEKWSATLTPPIEPDAIDDFESKYLTGVGLDSALLQLLRKSLCDSRRGCADEGRDGRIADDHPECTDCH